MGTGIGTGAAVPDRAVGILPEGRGIGIGIGTALPPEGVLRGGMIGAGMVPEIGVGMAIGIVP